MLPLHLVVSATLSKSNPLARICPRSNRFQSGSGSPARVYSARSTHRMSGQCLHETAPHLFSVQLARMMFTYITVLENSAVHCPVPGTMFAGPLPLSTIRGNGITHCHFYNDISGPRSKHISNLQHILSPTDDVHNDHDSLIFYHITEHIAYPSVKCRLGSDVSLHHILEFLPHPSTLIRRRSQHG